MNVKKICHSRYNLLDSKNFLYPFVFGMALFVFLFLWLFEPYGIENLADDEKLPVIGLYAGAGLVIAIIQFLVVQPLFFRKFTVCSTFFWLWLHLFLIGLATFLINDIMWNNARFYWPYLIYFQGIVLSVGILPIALLIAVHYAWLMKVRYQHALTINQKLSQPVIEEDEQEIILKSYNQKNELHTTNKKLICLNSADNYVEIWYMEKGHVTRQLLRNTLNNMEKHLTDFPVFFRCHKSFIVNKQFVHKVSGNAAGYKLYLKNLNFEVPVSRSLNKMVAGIM